MGKTVFLSYATGSFIAQRDKLCESALNVGFDEAIGLTDSDIKSTDFWQKNQHILSQPRGAGYWLWKPYIILEQLKKMSADDVLVYSDAGRSSYYNFERFPIKLIEKLNNETKGFLLGPALYQHGAAKKWIKRDCLILMNSDREEIIDKPTIQASPNFWKPTPSAFDFLEKWIHYASDYRCLTDAENTLGKENYKEFIDHRHDQSVLTLLAYQQNAPYLDFSYTLLFKLLALRPQSTLAHQFLKRIDDAEKILDNKSLLISLYDSYLFLSVAR